MPTRLIKPKRFGDERGWFSETYSRQVYEAAGVAGEFVQDNHAFSKAAYVLRGLHFQSPPKAQAKLIRCSRGAIFDIAVDIRAGSPTYGQHVAVELSAQNGWQLYVPRGFAHAYLTLTPDSEVQYKVDEYYAPEAEGGLIWNDPALRIAWPLDGATPTIAPRDAAWPVLDDLRTPFFYDGAPMTPLEI